MNLREALTSTKGILVAFVLFSIAPFARAAATSWFWQSQHRMAPVATALFLLLLAALVAGRYRWAWVLVALFYASALIGWVADPTSVKPTNVPLLIASLGAFVLLVSRPMRRRLRKPVSFPVRGLRRA